MREAKITEQRLDVITGLLPRPEDIIQHSPSLGIALQKALNVEGGASIDDICREYRNPIARLYEKLDRTTAPQVA